MATESTELVTLEHKDAMSVFTSENGMQPFLEQIRKHIDGFKGDASTKEGRQEIASMAFKVSRSKTYLENFGKACADEAKEIPRKIDRNRKLMKDTLDSWRDEVRKPLTEWEAADDARINRHFETIENLRRAAETLTTPDGSPMTLEQMRAVFESASTFKPNIKLQQEFAIEYEHMNSRLANVLRKAIPEREQAERDAAELADFRRQQAEREAKEAAERAESEAEERKRLEAEAAAKAEADRQTAAALAELEAAQRREREAAERAERERREAEERELLLRREKEDAERRAAEAEARIKREAEEAKAREFAETARRESNKRHVAKVKAEAICALRLFDIAEENICADIIELIADGKVPHVSITY